MVIIHLKGKHSLFKKCGGATGFSCAKESSLILTSHHKQKLTQKWINDLNMQIKILEENLGVILMILDLATYFKYDPKTTSRKRNYIPCTCNWNDTILPNLSIDYVNLTWIFPCHMPNSRSSIKIEK